MSTENSDNRESQVLDQEVVEAFASLFKGRADAYGSVEGRANKETVTLEHYEKHLRGEVSLGIYPLLDDGTCYFFAIDLDEKDFNKARAIRQELFDNFIPAYIAESKSKGYHIYGFALEEFIAKDIRRVLHHILEKLQIKAEIFPKQNRLNKTLSLGNYINLPSFGHTRPFLTGDMKAAPLAIAIDRIKFIPQESIDRLLRILPEAETNQKFGHTLEEIVGMLRQPLSVGERRPTLVRLVGYLRSHGVPERVTMALLLPWAEKAFIEPLPTDEIESHIRGIYQRYGVKQRHGKRTKPFRLEVPL